MLRREDAGALCEAAGGIPLAILWTVGQLGRSRTIEESLRRLRSASGDYARFAFHESVGQLAGENQSEALHLLYAASLFAEDASREALGFAAGLENREGVRDQSLGVLLDLSLLNLRDGSLVLSR